MDKHSAVVVLAGLGVLLITARMLGEAARALRLPPVVGEIAAGVLLGRTVLERLSPEVYAFLFPVIGEARVVLDGFLLLSVCLLLLSAGLEVELSSVLRQGRAAVVVSLTAVAVPLALGAVAGWAFPEFLGRPAATDAGTFALLLGTLMAITALPVISRILTDLDLLKSDLGMLIMAAAMTGDLFGWLMFSVLVTEGHGASPAWTVGAVTAMAAAAMTAGRWAFHRALPWLQSRLTWPGGVLTVTLSAALLMSAAAEAAGIHAVIGAFLAGVAVGNSRHLREHTREIIHQFVGNLFAPVFLAGIALRVDFVAGFDPVLTAVVLVLTCVGKWSGCTLGARWGRLSFREGQAVAVGMSVGGAMGIILGSLAFEAGLIRSDLLVAVVITALATSLAAGPVIERILQRGRKWELRDALDSRLYRPALAAKRAREAIEELAAPAAKLCGLGESAVVEAVWQREQLAATGVGFGLAVPHARLAELDRPVIAIGRSAEGIDFDSADGGPVHTVFLLLTPERERAMQADLIRRIARVFHDPESRLRIEHAGSFSEFAAVFNTMAKG
jgi:Kef-type K+ transport system membrane component KefB/mannitol/fructose-specific phosphotransferase system IIA component (Ntr-type)